MPRTKAADATEIDDQDALFPELDPDKPKEKELMKALKRYRTDKTAHAEAVKGPKETMDESMRRAIALMHEMELEKVRIDGEIFEVRPGDEKIAVKKAKKPKGEEDGEDDE